MIHVLRLSTRVAAYAAVLGAGALTLAYRPAPAYAQEVRCYLMVCTGTVCVARQIECPPTQEETPKEPPTAPTTTA